MYRFRIVLIAFAILSVAFTQFAESRAILTADANEVVYQIYDTETDNPIWMDSFHGISEAVKESTELERLSSIPDLDEGEYYLEIIVDGERYGDLMAFTGREELRRILSSGGDSYDIPSESGDIMDDGYILRLGGPDATDVTHIRGMLGIGTDAPSAQLHTTGSVRFAGAGTIGSGRVLTSDADGNATWQVLDVDNYEGWRLRVGTYDPYLVRSYDEVELVGTGGIDIEYEDIGGVHTVTIDGTGMGDSNWELVDSDRILQTRDNWGIFRHGNVAYGTGSNTHINLGIECTTGITATAYHYMTIGGGLRNMTGQSYATVSGGVNNRATGDGSFIGGGWGNFAEGNSSVIGGGEQNKTEGESTTISGGDQNQATGWYAFVGGGMQNEANGRYSVVGGGRDNEASGLNSFVGGGGYDEPDRGNTASGDHSAVVGGGMNTASGDHSFIGGGGTNTAGPGAYATVSGGSINRASGARSSICGGGDNTASGNYSTIAGGQNNNVSGTYSFAFGREVAVSADHTAQFFSSSYPGNFVVQGTGTFSNQVTIPETPVADVHAASKGYVDGLIGGISGSNWTQSGSVLRPNSTTWNVGIGTTSPTRRLHVVGGDALINSITVGRGSGNRDNNVAIGNQALESNSTGSMSAAIGYRAMWKSETGSHNVAFGFRSMQENISGGQNTAVGSNSLHENTTGISNTAIGYQALFTNRGNSRSTAVGRDAMRWADNREDGRETYNTAIGHSALWGASPSSGNTGRYNTAVGDEALFRNSSGDNNTAIGRQAGYNSSVVLTGDNNTFLGANTSHANSGITNCVALGYQAQPTANNRVHVGNTSINWIGGQVSWSTYSDKRAKRDVREDIPGLDFITRLKPVSYNWDVDALNNLMGVEIIQWEGKYDIENIRISGFLAQDVSKAARDCGFDFSGIENTADVYSLSYGQFVVPLVKAVQELDDRIVNVEDNGEVIEELRTQVEAQQVIIEELVRKIEALESGKE